MKSLCTRTRGLGILMAIAIAPSQGGGTDGTAPYDWRAVAERLLEPPAIAQLERDGLLIVDEPWRQVFTPYTSSNLPVFITSDSLLNAFHVLFAESVMQLEKSQARRLRGILQTVWANLSAAEAVTQGDEAIVADAKRRARVVIGTALRLLGEELLNADPAINTLVVEEVERVTAARAQTKPTWLGPPDQGFTSIDYTRFTPRGFYTASEDLSRYFRAVAWLHAIPFRVGHDTELLAAMIIGNTVSHLRIGETPMEMIYHHLSVFYRLLGRQDNWNLMDMANYAQLEEWLNADALDAVRARMSEDDGHSLIFDHMRLPPEIDTPVSERSFRVLSAHRTPDAILFQRTTDLREFLRSYPTGLEVAALLGSDFARARIEGVDREELLAEIDRARELLGESNLYTQYMRCLAALFEAPDPAAPSFMSGEAWAAKNCQTALAGWTQLRHTWALHAKQSASLDCGTSVSPGFVEPTPEFFSRMGSLVRDTEILLQELGAFEGDTLPFDRVLREAADEMERRIRELPPDETGVALAMYTAPGLESIGYGHPDVIPQGEEWGNARAYADRIVPLLRQWSDSISVGERPLNPRLQDHPWDMEEPIDRLWRLLSDLCMQLELVAHKQLWGRPLNWRDRYTLTGYGKQIARIMRYQGEAYLSPRDDAPRAIDVHWNHTQGRGLIVGIGRPRSLYVLYPTDVGPVLCRGAVLPYYEFRSDRRMNDGEWKNLLDSGDRPPIPAWVRPIVHDGELRQAGEAF